jgi:hypothetical protein
MIPVVVGVVVALIGLAILADAWLPEEASYGNERRRAARTERSLGGEACIGLAVLCVAAALIGRDTWRYSTVAMIAGSVLFLLGVFANRRYLRERLVNRGALRRGAPPAKVQPKTPPKGPLRPR